MSILKLYPLQDFRDTRDHMTNFDVILGHMIQNEHHVTMILRN